MRDVNPHLQLLDALAYNRFCALIDSLSELVQSQDCLALMTLITIFSNEGMAPGSLSSLAHTYLNLMRRRLMHVEGDTEERTFSKFRSGLCDIKELSLILQKMSMTQAAKEQEQMQLEMQQQQSRFEEIVEQQQQQLQQQQQQHGQMLLQGGPPPSATSTVNPVNDFDANFAEISELLQ